MNKPSWYPLKKKKKRINTDNKLGNIAVIDY